MKKIDGIYYTNDLKKATGSVSDLDTADFVKNVKIIGNNAFTNSCISAAVFPNKLKEIGFNAFRNSCLEEVLIENEVVLNESAFMCNPSLRRAEVNCRHIPGLCFAYCSELIYLDMILKNTETIGDRAFDHTKINSISFPDDLEYIGNSAFYGAEFKNGILKLPKNVKIIENYAFNLTNLTDIYVPDGITHIGTLQDTGFDTKIHMSKKTFDRLGLKSDKNIVFFTLEEILETMTFREANKECTGNSLKINKEI